MGGATQSGRIACFGSYTVNLQSREVHKKDQALKIQKQPYEVLVTLLERPGAVVTHEEFRQKLWPEDTFVDFDHSLRTSILKLREALGDSPTHPRYIATVPRQGYRFIAEVDFSPADQNSRESTAPAEYHNRRRVAALAGGGVLALLAVLVAFNVAGLLNRLLGGATGQPKIRSVAVLPLENLSGDPQQEYFADGMTDALITDLGKIKGLRVISRTSAMQYKKTRKTLPEIAQELHVDALLEGTVLRSGDRVRITAQLIRINPERHVWAETYHRNLREVLALQSGVALTIARHVHAKLTTQERTLLVAQNPVNPQAYTAYLKGRFERRRDDEQGIRKAVEYFQLAIRLDPNYALAYAGLAHAYFAMGKNELRSPRELYPKAEAAAQQALKIDGTLPDAYDKLGEIKFRYDWDWSGADAEFRRAIELSPGTSHFHYGYGSYLTLMGRWAQARNEIQRAQVLDPLSIYNQASMGNLFYCSHQFDRAVHQLQNTVGIFGGESTGYVYAILAKAYLGKRMFKAAIAEQQKAINIFGESPLHLAILGNMYGVAGKNLKALKILGQLKEQSKRKYVSPYDIALVYVGLGNKREAVSWLEKAYQAHSSNMSNLKVDPIFDPLRSDRRFQVILHRMNFPK